MKRSNRVASILLCTLLAGQGAGAQSKEVDPRNGSESNELLVYLAPGSDAGALASRYGLKRVRALVSNPDAHVLGAGSVEAARASLAALAGDRAVRRAFNNRYTVEVPHHGGTGEGGFADPGPGLPGGAILPPAPFEPNDPYFEPGATPYGQWHLGNALGMPEIGVEPAWLDAATGLGVTIGIVDSGIDTDHPDLSVDADSGYDFVHLDASPAPCPDNGLVDYCLSAYHGTSVAGLAGATGGNGIGVTGVAPLARVAGLRVPLKNSYLPSEYAGTAQLDRFVEAIAFGDPQQMPIKNHSYGNPSSYVGKPAVWDALRESAAAGRLHVSSAGNERLEPGSADTATSSESIPEMIQVAALGSDGRFAEYSNYGASVLVSAPSRGNVDLPGLLTTDLTGVVGSPQELEEDADYNASFGGTSGAAPIVAGALALAREVRSDLDVRLAKHLIARSSRKVDAQDASEASDGGWRTNAAGFEFNQNYGFGLLDAGALVCLAREDLALAPLRTWKSPVGHPSAFLPGKIPDGSSLGLTYTLPVQGKAGAFDALEEVGVTLAVKHADRGQLEIYLESPSGTRSRLLQRYDTEGELKPANIGFPGDSGTLEPWTFWTHVFWGERPEGDWKLILLDTERGTSGDVGSFQLQLRMGQLEGASATACEGAL